MVEKIFDNPKIYRVLVPLPENPLRSLNSYVIMTEERNLVIDTGFNREECYGALTEGLDELGIDIEDTDFFITHFHGDHCGTVGRIAGERSRIFMSEKDYSYLVGDFEDATWEGIESVYVEEGFPTDIVCRLKSSNQAKKYRPDRLFKAVTLQDRDVIRLGDAELVCMLTPGHTPGHMCLYLPEKKILFSGDHVLFDITPNITSWMGIADSLGDYMQSLEMIKDLDVEITLAAHRDSRGNLRERADEILEQHRIRLHDTAEVLRESERPLNAYEIAQRMKWNLRGRSWDSFPDNQKWFAMGESMSHIDYLVKRDLILKKIDTESGIYVYSLK